MTLHTNACQPSGFTLASAKSGCKSSTSGPSQNGPTASGSSSGATNLSSTLAASPAFQQVKQTQASLARLSRVHQIQQQQLSQINQSSHQSQVKESNNNSGSNSTSQHSKSTTFIDCLIRRFKDCFSEDFCTVPMFVVGNLSPGSDGK